MSETAGQVVPAATNNAPPPDPDAGKYEALRNELGIEVEAAEPAPQPEPQGEPEKQPVPRVEHENLASALKAEREARRTAEAEKQAILDLIERTRTQRQQPQPEAPKIPSEQEDPIGHFKAINAQMAARLEQLERGTNQTAEQLHAQSQHNQLLQIVQHSEAAITSEKNPEAKADYWDACTYLEGQRERELVRMYPDGSPYVQQYARQQGFASAADLRQAVLNHDRWAVAVQAVQMGVSPAEFYYSLATDRGYQSKPKATNGAANGKAQIEAAKRGRAASVSISGGDGGRKGAQDMSTADLAQLAIDDPDAFDKTWDEMKRLGRLG